MKQVIFPLVALVLIIASPADCGAEADDRETATATATSSGAVGLVESLRTVSAEDKLLVKLKNGNSVRGKFHEVSPHELKLSRGDKTIAVSETEVQQVYRLEKKSAGLHAAIGGAIGLGAFLVGHALAFPEERAPVHSDDPLEMAFVGGAGALIGWVIGRRARRQVLLYDAGLSAIISDTGRQ